MIDELPLLQNCMLDALLRIHDKCDPMKGKTAFYSRFDCVLCSNQVQNIAVLKDKLTRLTLQEKLFDFRACNQSRFHHSIASIKAIPKHETGLSHNFKAQNAITS